MRSAMLCSPWFCTFALSSLVLTPLTSEASPRSDPRDVISLVREAHLKARYLKFTAELTFKNGKPLEKSHVFKVVMGPEGEVRIDFYEKEELDYILQIFPESKSEGRGFLARETDARLKVSYEEVLIDPKHVRRLRDGKGLNKDQRCGAGFFFASFVGKKSHVISDHLPKLDKATVTVSPRIKNESQHVTFLTSRSALDSSGNRVEKEQLYTFRLTDGAMVGWERRDRRGNDMKIVNRLVLSEVTFNEEIEDKSIFFDVPKLKEESEDEK